MNAVPAQGTFHFKWGRALGKGGLGRVDEIIVTASSSAYAVGAQLAAKRLNQKWRAHPEAKQRFEREIAVVRSMSHPGIVAYCGENLAKGSERFYVMPLYQTSLRQALAAARTGFQLLSVVNFALEAVRALEYAHARGFIHRDLKPENILLDANGRAVIADWGIGYFIHQDSVVLEHLTRGGGLGTAYYCSREQWVTGKCAANGDIYSLGLVLAELLVGKQVPIELGGGITHDVLPIRNGASILMNQVLKWMTHIHAGQRAQMMTEVRTSLLQVLQYASSV